MPISTPDNSASGFVLTVPGEGEIILEEDQHLEYIGSGITYQLGIVTDINEMFKSVKTGFMKIEDNKSEAVNLELNTTANGNCNEILNSKLFFNENLLSYSGFNNGVTQNTISAAIVATEFHTPGPLNLPTNSDFVVPISTDSQRTPIVYTTESGVETSFMIVPTGAVLSQHHAITNTYTTYIKVDDLFSQINENLKGVMEFSLHVAAGDGVYSGIRLAYSEKDASDNFILPHSQKIHALVTNLINHLAGVNEVNSQEINDELVVKWKNEMIWTVEPNQPWAPVNTTSYSLIGAMAPVENLYYVFPQTTTLTWESNTPYSSVTVSDFLKLPILKVLTGAEDIPTGSGKQFKQESLARLMYHIADPDNGAAFTPAHFWNEDNSSGLPSGLLYEMIQHDRIQPMKVDASVPNDTEWVSGDDISLVDHGKIKLDNGDSLVRRIKLKGDTAGDARYVYLEIILKHSDKKNEPNYFDTETLCHYNPAPLKL